MLKSLGAAALRGVQRRHKSLLASAEAAKQRMEEDKQELLDFWPQALADLKEASRVVGIPEETEWFGRVLEWNVPHGKMIRGLIALNTCRELVPKLDTSQAKSLALAVECLQACFLLSDDVIDGGTTRRGKTSWNALPEVGTGVINDAFLLHSAASQLLLRYFRSSPSYAHLMETFNDTTFWTMMGENFDIHHNAHGKKVVDIATFQVHKINADTKSSYYTFYCPTAVAMHVAGISDPKDHEVVWKITSDIGYLFVVQDDILDCYPTGVNAKSYAKSSTDIITGKCTWLLCEAKQRANHKQLSTLRECYGVNDKEKMKAVVQVYDELGLRDLFLEFQRNTFIEIAAEIDKQKAVKPSVLHYILDKVKDNSKML